MFLWKVILGYNGVLNSFLLWLEMISEPLTFILYNSNAVIIALTHGWAPFAILPIFVSLEKIDRSLLEASRDLGDGPFIKFLTTTAIKGCQKRIILSQRLETISHRWSFGGMTGAMIANMIQVQTSPKLITPHLPRLWIIISGSL